jgi:hypothetical protein
MLDDGARVVDRLAREVRQLAAANADGDASRDSQEHRVIT